MAEPVPILKAGLRHGLRRNGVHDPGRGTQGRPAGTIQDHQRLLQRSNRIRPELGVLAQKRTERTDTGAYVHHRPEVTTPDFLIVLADVDPDVSGLRERFPYYGWVGEGEMTRPFRFDDELCR